jgi:hypothetical protein
VENFVKVIRSLKHLLQQSGCKRQAWTCFALTGSALSEQEISLRLSLITRVLFIVKFIN